MNKIVRKDGINYSRRPKRGLIPSQNQYSTYIQKLTEAKDIHTLLALRLGCEMGLSRMEIVNLEVRNLDREHTRGLWVEIAKKVKRGKNFVMRSREIPVNINLYSLLINYMDKDIKYIFRREKSLDILKPLQHQQINWLYERAGIPWSSHKSRHFFKNAVRDWMRKNRQMDEELIRHYMGHAYLDAHQSYGDFSWDYKIEIMDNVFGGK